MLLAAGGCPHWTLGTVAGLVGPILALTGLDTCGVNLSGLSTAGKTTAQRLAVSAWTAPRIGAGLLQSLRTTESALEGLAQTSSGAVLALDEVAHADGRALGRTIYSLAGGIGKARMTAAALLRGRYAWQTFVVLSGECSLEAKVRRDGGQWLAGMAVRLPDVDVTGVNQAAPRATFDAIAGVERHHGHAGPALVAGLIAEGHHRSPDALREQVLRAAQLIAGPNADSAQTRAAVPFALLLAAGELAKEFDLIPTTADVRGAVMWAWGRFLDSADAGALDPEGQAIAQLRTWIAGRWDVTVKSVDEAIDRTDIGRRPNNREALAWYDEEVVYMPTGAIAEAAGGALKEQHVAEVLEKRGLLARRHDAKRRAVRWVPQVGRVDCYALRRDHFGRVDTAAEPEDEAVFAVHRGGRA